MKNFLPPAFALSEPELGDYRYEFKLASEGLLPAQARSWIRLHPQGFRRAYPARVVNNLYFDTNDLQSFNDNLAGTSLRRKLRVRWYGPGEGSYVRFPVLELKMKENMLGAKKQQPLDLTLDLARPYREIWQMITSQLGAEWRAHVFAPIYPTLINRYWREYYVSPDEAIRVTLDYDLQAYEQRMFGRPNLARRMPLQDVTIIEVKAALQHEERVQQVMGQFPIQRGRSSKYVSGLMGGHF